MKPSVASIVLVGLCFTAAADDRKIELFDQSQLLQASVAEQESRLILEIEPSLASFQKTLAELEQLDRKIERICVLHALENYPDKIEWTNPYSWGFSVSTTKEREALSRENAQLKSLLGELESIKHDLRGQAEDWKRCNSIRRANKGTLAAIHAEMHERLMALQKEMDALLEIAQPEPQPDG